jgi:integrase
MPKAKVFKLTLATVADATCPPDKKDVLLFDGEVKGFALRVTKSGGKSFLAQYQGATGKRRVVLGSFGVLTPDQARQKAKVVLGQAAEGRDPFAERQAAEAAQRAAEATEKAQAAAEVFTLAKLIDAWGTARAADRDAAYVKIATASMRNHLAGWLKRPAVSITTAEAVARLDEVKAKAEVGGPTAANRLLGYARASYQWAARRQMVGSNPWRGIEQPARLASRDRVLSGEEIGAIWRATNKLESEAYRHFAQTLLLTLQRLSEVAGLRWSELKPEGTWVLPADRSKKSNMANTIHLAAPVRAILADVKRVGPFVFSATGKCPVAGFSALKRALDAAILAERTERGLLPIKPWTFHDFRRSGVTHLANNKVSPHVADKLLNHKKIGTLSAVGLIYQLSEFLPERASALDKWAALVIDAAAEESVMQLAAE